MNAAIKSKLKWECLGKPDLETTLTRRRRSLLDFCTEAGIVDEATADKALEEQSKHFSISNKFAAAVYAFVEEMQLTKLEEKEEEERNVPAPELPSSSSNDEAAERAKNSNFDEQSAKLRKKKIG